MREKAPINLARRLIEKHDLDPPIDIDNLTRRFAHVERVDLPIDIDGFCIDIKVPGKRPRVFLNRDRPIARTRFTLAHELGHVLIPWHVGMFLDEIAPEKELVSSDDGDDYWEIENEANRFASELLMPTDWVKAIIATTSDPNQIVLNVTDSAKVSRAAATLKVLGNLPAGYVYAQVAADGRVIASGRSDRTVTNQPSWGERIQPATLYPSSDQCWITHRQNVKHYWWHFPKKAWLPKTRNDNRKWRAILTQIANDLGLEPDQAKHFRQSVNGIIGYANSHVILERIRTRQTLYAAALDRFYSRARDSTQIRKLTEHPDFSVFLAKRVIDLI